MIFRRLPAMVLAIAVTAFTQETAQPAGPNDGQGRRGLWTGMGGGRGILGTVTEVAADHYTVRTETGEIYTIHFSVNTRIVKAPAGRRGGPRDDDSPPAPPQALKPSEIKVGDAITAGGEVDAEAKSVGAVFIAVVDPERARQMREMAANFGKTWLMGRVIAIDGVKVTLQGGPGNAAHSFLADENTSFRRRREPITLGDVQIGDAVRVEGTVRGGTFVASAVAVMGQPSAPAPSPGQPR